MRRWIALMATTGVAANCTERDPQRIDSPVVATCEMGAPISGNFVFESHHGKDCVGPSGLSGTKQEGEACAQAIECEPRCCACPAGTIVYWAAGCDGTCKGTEFVCCSADRPMHACEST